MAGQRGARTSWSGSILPLAYSATVLSDTSKSVIYPLNYPSSLPIHPIHPPTDPPHILPATSLITQTPSLTYPPNQSNNHPPLFIKPLLCPRLCAVDWDTVKGRLAHSSSPAAYDLVEETYIVKIPQMGIYLEVEGSALEEKEKASIRTCNTET